MSATRTIAKALVLLVAFGLLVACDDDEDKKTTYIVDVYDTPNVKVIIRPFPSKDPRKHQVTVKHPPEVEVEVIERDPDEEEEIYKKFTSIVLLGSLCVWLAFGWNSLVRHRFSYDVDTSAAPSPPTYQRG